MSSQLAARAAATAIAATNVYKPGHNDHIINNKMNKPLKQIGIAYNSQISAAYPLSKEIGNFLERLDAQIVVLCPIQEKTLRNCITENSLDALIILGGDGTMLRASHLCAAAEVPIVGINLGNFGFLMELQPNEWKDMLPRLLEGDYRLEMRMLLRAEHIRSDKALSSSLVVNEVVVAAVSMCAPSA